MDKNLVLQNLTESFDVLKDSWSTKSEAITNCIVETEVFDGVLAMDMWSYVIRINESLLNDIEESEKLIHNVLNRFYKKYEIYCNEEYICRALLIHVAPHVVKCEPLIRYIFGKTINAGHILGTWSEFIPVVIAGILFQEDEKAVQLLIHSLTHNNNMKDISPGQLLIKANKYIETIVKHPDYMDKTTYQITPMVKNVLLESVSMVEDKEIRAECTIAVLSF